MTRGQRNILTAALIFAITPLILTFAQGTAAQKKIQEFSEKYTKIMNETLKAYNDENHEEFYKDFASSRRARTERTFKYMWVDDYKKQYGKLVSKKLDLGQSHAKEPYPLLVYAAKFEKNDTVGIKFSFIKENDTYKIFSLRFDDIRK